MQKIPSGYLNSNHFLKHDRATAPLSVPGNAVNRDYVDTKINNLDDEIRKYIDKRIYELVFGNSIQLIKQ